MQRMLVVSLLSSGLCVLGGSAALAQTPTPGQSPSPGQSTTPRNTPEMNTQPGAQPGTQPGTQPGPMAGDTAGMSGRVNDKKFVLNAALGGMTEVELGKLAAGKASSDGVKQFGQKMVDDHSKANDELKQVASSENITIPDSLDPKHRSRVEKLSKLSGAAFDKAYVKDQLKDHQKDVSEFQSEAQGGTNPKVKEFASKTLPVLQEHLTHIKGLSEQTTAK